MLESEEFSGPPRPRLDFIRDEKEPGFPVQLFERARKLCRDRSDPPLPLDEFENHGSSLRADGFPERFRVIERQETASFEEGTESVPVLRTVHQRERPHCPPVKRIAQRKDLGLSAGRAPLPGDLDRPLDRLGSAVAEEHPRVTGKTGQQLGQPYLRLLEEIV